MSTNGKAESPTLMASSTVPSKAFGMVPVWILRDPDLSPGAVRLFGLLAALYVTRPGYSAPAPRLVDLAAELHVSERTVRSWRDELLAVRAISRVDRGNQPDLYVVASIEAAGPLSEEIFTDRAESVEADFHSDRKHTSTRTSSKENSKKTARTVQDSADVRPPSEDRSDVEPLRFCELHKYGYRTICPKCGDDPAPTTIDNQTGVPLHHATDEERDRVETVLAGIRGRLTRGEP